MDVNKTYDKIAEVIKQRGPSLPLQISKEIGMSSLFTSAFLSEMADAKKIKISHLKVGGSPLYFLDGQEDKLENYHNFMHTKEIEALFLLKKNKFLKDLDQEPAVRIALRSIQDFAAGFNFNGEIYWRYFSIPESESIELINKIIVKPKEPKAEIKKEVTKPKIIKIKKIIEFRNPLVIPTVKKQKTKSDFSLKVIDFINKNKLVIIEEKEFDDNEYNCIVQINSELGSINFLTQAKDKKNITEADLRRLLSDAQSIPLPALIIYRGNINKKAVNFLKNYNSILKEMKMD